MRSNLDIFSDDQEVTGTADADFSDNYVDVGKHAGKGQPVTIRVRVTTLFAGLTNLSVGVWECDTYDGTYTVVEVSEVVVAASLVVGYEFLLRFLPKVTDRYIKLKYTWTGTGTAGKLAADVVEGEDFPYREGLYLSPTNPTGLKATA